MRDLKIFDHTSPFYSGNVFIDHRLNCLGNFFMSDSLHLIDFHRNCFTITADGNGEHKTFLIPSNNGKEPNKVRLFVPVQKKDMRGVRMRRNYRKFILHALKKPVIYRQQMILRNLFSTY